MKKKTRDKKEYLFKVTRTVHHEFTKEQISDLLCTGLEGGSRYWASIEEFIEPSKPIQPLDGKRVYKHLEYPISEDGGIIMKDHESGKKYKLNRRKIISGLKKFAVKSPRHFNNFVEQNSEYDAVTGDIFIQCCLLGDILYG